MKHRAAWAGVACVVFSTQAAWAADEGTEVSAHNAVYVELLGPGLLYSFNYERRIGDVGLRAGLSYLSFSASAGDSNAKASITIIPLTASYIGIGGEKAKLELGGGGLIAIASAEASGLGESVSASGVGAAGTVLVGFRYHPDRGGFQFRVGASPIVGAGGVLPWGYLSLGAAF